MQQFTLPSYTKHGALLSFLVVMFGAVLLVTPNALAAPQLPSQSQQHGPAFGKQNQGGKSHLVQDPKWYAAKLAGKVRVPGMPPANAIQPYSIPVSYQLSTYTTGNTWEPEGAGTDSAGRSYSDNYYWLMCGEGATTAALGYWNRPIATNGTHSFTDPHTTTTWNDTYNRSFLMYLTTQVYPPSYGSAGEFTYGTYSTVNGQTQGTTTAVDLRDALNWEASNHNTSTWSTYFYAVVFANSLSQSDLLSDVETDLTQLGSEGLHVPVVVGVNTAYLTNWQGTGKSLSHYVAVVGYNNSAGTYTYIDSCGKTCGSTGQGVFTVPQSKLWQGIEDNLGNGSLVW